MSAAPQPAGNNYFDSLKLLQFQRLNKKRFQFKLFLFMKLPAAWWAGLRLIYLDNHACAAAVPYKWLTQNPFRSTYFACLSMAAELSTGALAMMYSRAAINPVSMLVTRLEVDFLKKATSLTTFTCNEGDSIRTAIAKAIATGEAQQVEVMTIGQSENAELVAQCRITWSFKAKMKS
ncbi:thioesterase [Chitinophaga caeni]|uniref:Thioesterase n=1 Tax=Chitinophaga caeni TaxID=2029983 RepID=A0A291QT76_9BACT|nr:DUF4442 domain-containing protein [Chitinophaga caeni]ATL47178.1 thioesterase [Chitinophaga caeni]